MVPVCAQRRLVGTRPPVLARRPCDHRNMCVPSVSLRRRTDVVDQGSNARNFVWYAAAFAWAWTTANGSKTRGSTRTSTMSSTILLHGISPASTRLVSSWSSAHSLSYLLPHFLLLVICSLHHHRRNHTIPYRFSLTPFRIHPGHDGLTIPLSFQALSRTRCHPAPSHAYDVYCISNELCVYSLVSYSGVFSFRCPFVLLGRCMYIIGVQ